MERYLYISPAIVAILIFIYMRNQQAKRNDKLRERLWKREEELIQMLSAKKDKKENTDNE
jgi:DNA topoisomerase IB